MNLRRRISILCLLAVASLALYGGVRHLSPTLVEHVVERMLAEKAPRGVGSEEISRRLKALLASVGGEDEKLARLFQISQRLEKVQQITAAELSQLLALP